MLIIFIYCKMEILIYIFHFVKLRLNISVRRNKSVYTEVAVLLFAAPVIAVTKIFTVHLISIQTLMCVFISIIVPRAAFCIFRNSRLVNPIPYKAAHHIIRASYSVPIFFKISYGVAHSVGILAHNIRNLFSSSCFHC